MKNYDESAADLKTRPAPFSPAPFPKAPGIVDTAPYLAIIPVLFAQLHALFTPDHVGRGAASRVGQIRRLLYVLYKIERQNFCQWLMRAMKSDPAWQAQVREDLGGDKAMALWERRQLALRAPAPVKRAKPENAQENDRKPRKCGEVKTDRHGRFCLAPLTRATARMLKPRRGLTGTPNNPGPLFIWPKAVPVTPDDLRPEPGAGKPGTREPDDIAAPDFRELVRIWESILAGYHMWNRKLVTADLAITIPAFRQDIEPP